MESILELTLFEIISALRAGEISSRELTQFYLDRTQLLEPELHAYLTFAPEQALAQAEAADRRMAGLRREGQAYPPLLGLPLAVKDVLCVSGLPCTCGSRILEGYIPPYNATVVARLLEAGVVILGKTNTDEFAMGSSTENSAYGVTHNPWNLQRVPGGSSGGSAAAVAARMVPLALGTDTGGSVRQPAAFCGISGLKPTYGRVSRYGLVAYGSSLDVVGLLGLSVIDLELVLPLIAGKDPLDATSMDMPALGADRMTNGNLHGLRVGVPEEYFVPGMQPQVERSVRQAIETLADLGASIQPVQLPHTAYAVPVYYLIAPAEASANLARYDGLRYGQRVPAEALIDVFQRTRGEKFGPEVKRRIMLGTYALSAGYYEAYYGQAQKVRTLIKRDFECAFEHVDVIAAPVAPTTAFPIGSHGDDPLAMYLEDIFTLPANLAGVPALAFPVGFDQDGLPVGMQLMATHFGEGLLFRVGQAYQGVTQWHKQLPPLGGS